MMFVAPPALAGKRVLIVEDELMVALLIEDLLADLGCSTVGPCGSVGKALEAAQTGVFDLAVLDVNLGGEMVYPVAEALAERHIPFLFLSGYGEEAIPPGHAGWRVCAKPFKADHLAEMLSAVVEDQVH
jgi:CheY-like chemotaxis protein